MKSLAILLILTLGALFAIVQAPSPKASASSPAKSIGLFAYPMNQQDPEQQLKDENDCYSSAKQQTGVDAQAPPPADPSAEEQQAAQKQAAQQAAAATPKGGAVKGSARGAAGGAAIGAIAGDAGTGAAVGATAGAVRGRRQQKKAQQGAQQQAAEKLLRRNIGARRKPTPSTREHRYFQEGVLGMYGSPKIFRQVTGRLPLSELQAPLSVLTVQQCPTGL